MESSPPKSPNLEAKKQALRQELLMLRANMPERAERARVLANRTRRWLNTMPTSRLAFYWPVRGECDLTAVITEWLSADPKRCAALPVIEADALNFLTWTPTTPMVQGPYGIAIPPHTATPLAPQVLLVPCVGVDQNRYRLGYGGGYYDRTLARLNPRPVMVGICFDCGRVKNLAPQPHDIRMDLVITESGVL